MREFYKLQIRNGTTGTNHVDEVLKDERITSHIDYAGVEFEKLNKGDVLLIHKGSNPVCLVKVLNKITNTSEINGTDFGINYKVKILSYFQDLEESLSFKKNNSKIGPNGTFTHLYNDSKTLQFIKEWFGYIQRNENMETIKALLEYKKQIILQGPPGTGKTRLAKMIAEEMTKASAITNPIQLIDDFLKNFDTKSAEVIKARSKNEELLKQFQSKFPIATLKDITKESYCIGTGSNDSFCWWIERGLISLGYYFPGSARSYQIFWKKSINEYSKHGLAANIENDDDAAKRVVLLISDFLEHKNIQLATTFLGTSFLLKILHSYFPEKYFPVNSIPCLENILKLFGENYSSLNAFEKNLKVQELFEERKKALGSNVSSIEFMQFLFGNFDLKGKIEIKTNQIISKGEYKIIQFHPSYSYEDFVRGISAKTNSDNKVFYKVEDRILMEFAREALDNSKSKYVLILDEINRANLSSVLGELIYALEYRYNHIEKNLKEASVESLYDISEDDGESNRVLLLPDNLYIIGTMNTADRSVGHIDYAIKRRFAFVDVPPTDQAIDDVVKDQTLNLKAKALYKKVENLFNEDKAKPVYLQSDFKAKDVQLGHSYFLAETEKQLDLKLEFEIKPLLNEYVKDGILSEEAIKEIQTL